MTRSVRKTVLMATACVLVLGFAAPKADASHAFVGAEKCKMCHNSPAKGAQFAKWVSTKHSKAFATLGSEEAKKVAAAKGVADPQKDAACLRCHVTAAVASKELLTDKYKAEEGVSCESCHGPGGDYWKMDVMKDSARAMAAGMVLPNEATCKGCHNPESPTFKAFDFKTAFAEIAHSNPLAKQ